MAAVIPTAARRHRRARLRPRRGLVEADGPAWTGRIRWNGAAKCALDIAMHDFVGKVLGVPVHELIAPLPPTIPPTDFTIGIDEPAIVAERRRPRRGLPGAQDQAAAGRRTSRRSGRSAASSAARSGSTRTPAGRATTPSACSPRSSSSGSSSSSSRSPPAPPRPRVAPGALVDPDRRGRERGHVPRISTRWSASSQGVNVKLAKCGGIGPAKAMLERARALGFRTFLGCMEETSVGIAGSAAVASLADWVDLDGCLLLADDPFEGLVLGADHRWILPSRPGLGLTRTRRLSPSTLGPHGVRRTPVRVDKLVDEVVDKPPSRRSDADLRCRPPVAETRGIRGRTVRGHDSGGGSDPSDRRTEFRIASAARSRAGLRRSREGTPSMEAHGASLAHAATPTRSNSCGSATAAAASAGRSCMTRCAPSPPAGCSAGRAPTSSRGSGSGSACSTCRGSRGWPRRSSPRSRPCAARSPWRSWPSRRPSDRGCRDPDGRRERSRDRRSTGARAGGGRRRPGGRPPPSEPVERSFDVPIRSLPPRPGRRLAGAQPAYRGQARILRLAISPSIWRSAST